MGCTCALHFVFRTTQNCTTAQPFRSVFSQFAPRIFTSGVAWIYIIVAADFTQGNANGFEITTVKSGHLYRYQGFSVYE
jgi:hypothetical protein